MSRILFATSRGEWTELRCPKSTLGWMRKLLTVSELALTTFSMSMAHHLLSAINEHRRKSTCLHGISILLQLHRGKDLRKARETDLLMFWLPSMSTFRRGPSATMAQERCHPIQGILPHTHLPGLCALVNEFIKHRFRNNFLLCWSSSHTRTSCVQHS